VQDRDQQDGDRPGEVEDAGGAFEDRVGVPQVGLDVVGHALGAAGQQGLGVAEHDRVRKSWSTYATGYSASSSPGDCPAEPRAGIQAQPNHPVTAPGHGALSSAPQTRDLMQVNGPRACGAHWHTRRLGGNAGMAGDDSKVARLRAASAEPLR